MYRAADIGLHKYVHYEITYLVMKWLDEGKAKGQQWLLKAKIPQYAIVNST